MKKTNRIIIECENNMEFLVDAKTLEPLGTSYYDPYPSTMLNPKEYPTMFYGDWVKLRSIND